MSASSGPQALARPPYDPQLDTLLANSPLPTAITPEMIEPLRAAPFTAPIEEVLSTRNLDHKAVSMYAAPARATDLSELPPAFIDVGSAEVFRDEDVAYASRLWASGVQVELHVWAGGFHIFDGAAPHAALSVAALQARTAWVRRTIGARS